ncbi:MAG TPA: arylsulfotransferase family protein [Gaiellaceae bacterium]|nr:arylsulfotransferase family protein [Gaiellaceae bacterium]
MAALLVAGCGASPRLASLDFISRPDLRPPPVRVLKQARSTGHGFVFIAPKGKVAQAGPLIVDDAGHVVWFRPLDTRGVTDFRVQHYRGRPVLTWWRGKPTRETGTGAYTIADASYRRIATVTPGHGLVGDIHEFLITPRDTALLTIFHRIRVDGRAVFEGVVQEIDITTHRVVFEWHSIEHVGLGESYAAPPAKQSVPLDYFHINSIDVEPHGDLLVSARNTRAVYEIDRRSGRIRWRLGGKRSDFTFGPGARFAWQHDARRLPDGTISLFDNEAAPRVGPQSRGIVLRLDVGRMHATLVRSFVHHPPLVAVDQGNMQRLPDGHFLVGWGHQPWYTEYSPNGRVLLDARFGGDDNSYRAYRFMWVGRPTTGPTVVVHGDTAYVSWNGATRVARWRLLAGAAPDDVGVVRTVRKRTFETKLAIPNGARYVAVEALDANGGLLHVSATVQHR